jgi:DNA processing protein
MKLNTENVVKLLQVKGVGRMKLFKLESLITFTPYDDKELSEFLIEKSPILKIPQSNIAEILSAFHRGQEILESSKESGITTVSFWDDGYPEQLRDIESAPAVLNILGNVKGLLDAPAVAVIGTREPSEYGKTIGERIGFRLAEKGINVVSGLALGCDTAGHIGALKAGGMTTAVLAHGLDMVYPSANRPLASKILESGGCLVSEYFIKTRAMSNFFVERDRLQAGLSKATIVVETDIKGGTMHTVRDTISFKRILAAFDHPFDKENDKSRGNKMLIRESGAIKLQTKEDLDEIISLINPSTIPQPDNENKVAIENIEVPALFNLEEYDLLNSLDNTQEKRKKARKKKEKKVLPHSQQKLYREMSLIFDLDMTLVDSKLAEPYRKPNQWATAYSHIPNFTMYEGIVKVLKYLEEKKIAYCIVTSSPSTYCQKVCEHWNISSKHLVCYHDTTRRKPYADPILLALNRMKVQADEALSFGDREIDIQASHAAGVKSVACLWGCEDEKSLLESKPTYTLKSPSEIIPLIEKHYKLETIEKSS